MRIPNIDLLRTIAATGILYLHTHTISCKFYNTELFAGFYQVFSNLHRCVYLFFGLSSYLILRSFISIWNTEPSFNSSIGKYYRKRFIRIFPVYLLVNIVCFIALKVTKLWDITYVEGFASITYTYTIITGNLNPINPVFWSLETEIQFYIVFPIIYFLVRQYKPGKYLLFLYSIFSSLFLYGLWKSANLERSIFYHSIYFVFGILAYLVVTKWKDKIVLQKRSLTIVFFTSIIALFAIEIPSHVQNVVNSFLIAVILITGVKLSQISSKAKINDFISGLANSSYSLYLIHYPVLYVLILAFKYLNIGNPFAQYVIIPCLTVISAHLFYLKVEKVLNLSISKFNNQASK